jgi:hypothetical protein
VWALEVTTPFKHTRGDGPLNARGVGQRLESGAVCARARARFLCQHFIRLHIIQRSTLQFLLPHPQSTECPKSCFKLA